MFVFVFVLGKDVDDPGALRLLKRIRKHITKERRGNGSAYVMPHAATNNGAAHVLAESI